MTDENWDQMLSVNLKGTFHMVQAVMPGNIITEGLKAQGEDYLDEMAKSVPTKSLGEPQDIGHAA